MHNYNEPHALIGQKENIGGNEVVRVGETRTPSRSELVGMSDSTATAENSPADPQMIVVQSYHRTQKSHSWVYPKRKEYVCPHKNMYRNAHRSIIHNSQQVDTTQKSITEDGQVRSIHSGILLNFKMECSTEPSSLREMRTQSPNTV